MRVGAFGMVYRRKRRWSCIPTNGIGSWQTRMPTEHRGRSRITISVVSAEGQTLDPLGILTLV
jgi:hypothetical protein